MPSRSGKSSGSETQNGKQPQENNPFNVADAVSGSSYENGSIKKEANESVITTILSSFGECIQSLLNLGMGHYLQTTFYTNLNPDSVFSKEEMLCTLQENVKSSQKKLEQKLKEGDFLKVLEKIGKIFYLKFQDHPTYLTLTENEDLLICFLHISVERKSELERVIPKWMKMVTEVLKKIKNLREFYHFLVEVKLNVAQYRTYTLLRQLMEEGDFPRETAIELLEFISQHDIVEEWTVSPRLRDICLNYISELDTRILRQIVNVRKPRIMLENENTVVVTGEHVKFTDFLVNDAPRPLQFKMNPLPTNVTTLKVYATEKVFIDLSVLEKTGNFTFILISPVWEVIGEKRSIVLMGQSGRLHVPSRASDGVRPGDWGENGAHGKSGANGGNFVGLFKTVQGGMLEIRSIGGNGGEGQDGGNGAVGERGADSRPDEFPDPMLDNLKDQFPRRCVAGEVQLVLHIYFVQRFTLLGEQGKEGGFGGIGGPGGAPGQPGIVQMSGSHENIGVIRKYGERGDDGRNGDCGEKGNNGRALTINCLESRLDRILFSDKWLRWGNKMHWNNTPNETKTPLSVIPLPFHNNTELNRDNMPAKSLALWKYMSEYKSFINESSSVVGQAFITDLELNSVLAPEFWKVHTLAKEFLDLEQRNVENAQLQHHIYSHFQHKISLLLCFKQEDLTIPAKKLLNTLASCTVSKLIHLNATQQPIPLIINVQPYLQVIERELESLKTTRIQIAGVERHTNFQAHLDSKIQQLKFLIESHVQPALHSATASLSRMEASTVQELNACLFIAKEQSKQKKKDLESSKKLSLFKSLVEYRPYIKKMLAMESAISFGFKMITSYPKVAIAVHVGLAALAGLESFLQFCEENQKKTDRLEMQEDFLGKIIQNSSQIQLQNQLSTSSHQLAVVEDTILQDELLKEMSELVELLSGFKLALEKLQTAVKEQAQLSPEDVNKFRRMKEELIRMFGEIGKKLSKSAKSTAEKVTRLRLWFLIADFVEPKTCIQLFKESLCKMEDHFLEVAVEEAERHVKIVEARINDVQKDFQPLLRKTKAHLMSQCETASPHLSLEFKLLAGKTLLSLKTEWNELVGGMKVANEVEICLDSMKEALTILTEIYEQIERNQETKMLASLITNVGDEWESGENYEFNLLTAKLEFLRKLNILRVDFERGVLAVKQWSFPYAYKFLENSILNFSNEMNGKIETLLNISGGEVEGIWRTFEKISENCLQELKRLRVEVDKSECQIEEEDENWMLTEFSSQNSQPFFTWGSPIWRFCIDKLFSGEDILLKSDFTQKTLHNGKAAIKFKTIELYIKHREASKQGGLDNLLTHFKVTMTHSGISYYRVLGKVYVITTSKRVLSYRIKENQGKKVEYSLACEKLENGSNNILLSPYTLWTFQLRLEDVENKQQLWEALAKYAPHVELELRGKGIYVDEEAAKKTRNFSQLEEQQLGKYYEIL